MVASTVDIPMLNIRVIPNFFQSPDFCLVVSRRVVDPRTLHDFLVGSCRIVSCRVVSCNVRWALGSEFDSAARLSKKPGSVWNCLWGHALKRSHRIIRKSRVLYPGPGSLSSATWPLLPKKHYNGLITIEQIRYDMVERLPRDVAISAGLGFSACFIDLVPQPTTNHG